MASMAKTTSSRGMSSTLAISSTVGSRWFSAMRLLPGLQDPVGGVPHGAGDPDGAVVPEVAADLAYDHGHTVGGKLHRLGDVEVVDGLDEPDAAHLKQVVHVLAPAREPLDHRQHQPQIPLDQFFTGLPGPRPCCGAAAPWSHSLFRTFSFAVLTPAISTFPCIYPPPAVKLDGVSMPLPRFFLYGRFLPIPAA